MLVTLKVLPEMCYCGWKENRRKEKRRKRGLLGVIELTQDDVTKETLTIRKIRCNI